MANESHLEKLKQDVSAWNQWRLDHPEITPNLINAQLNGADLRGADLSGALLLKADLRGANLCSAELSLANLCSAELDGAKLVGANLNGAYLKWAYLTGADLCGADLSGANLTWARLDEANIAKATLTGCAVYGLSVWGLRGAPKEQLNLVVSPRDPPPNKPVEPVLTVDYLEMAQFIYLLTRYEKLRNIIDAITSKVVLILGRFTAERKPTLDAIREELRKFDYVPVLFDFEKPESQNYIEPVLIAHMAKFIIADFTAPKIVLEEVPMIVATFLKGIVVPVVPLLQEGASVPTTLFNLSQNYKSVLETYWYKDVSDLTASLREKVIEPANERAEQVTRQMKEFLEIQGRSL
jgi:hypothetical protein